VNITADRMSIGHEDQEKATLQELVAHIASTWVPWGEVAGSPDTTWGQLEEIFSTRNPHSDQQNQEAGQTTADQTAARVLELVALEIEEPDWGGRRRGFRVGGHSCHPGA
jgi:hypothetical protein